MKQFSLFASLLMLICLFSACDSSSEEAGEGTQAESVTQEDEATKLYAAVGNLRVRAEPNLEAEVVATLGEGEAISFLEEETKFKTKIELRGQEYNEPWLKVETAEGEVGWVYGGAVEKEATSENAWLFVPDQRVGKLKKGMTMSDVKKVFGAQNVKEDTVWFPEGMFALGYTVYKGKPNELQVLPDAGYDEDGTAPVNDSDEIGAIRIQQKGTQWHSPEGITIGTSLDELNRLNGKAFKFAGFGWDYGGTVFGWEGGNLSMYKSLGIQLEPDYETVNTREGGEDVYLAFLGDQTILSDQKGSEKLKIEVTRITVNF